MSVVIIGGNEFMERRHCELCKKYGCNAKVFCQKEETLSGLRKGEDDVTEVLEKAVAGVVILAGAAGMSVLKRKLLEMSRVSRT